MTLDLQIVLFGLLASGCLTGVLAVVLWWFSRHPGQGLYRVWAGAWLAFALYSCVGAGSMAFATWAPERAAARFLLSAVAQAANTAGALLLLLGSLAFARQSPPAGRRLAQALGASLLLGVLLAGIGLMGAPGWVRPLYRSLMVAASSIGGAALILRSPSGRSMPARLLGLAMAGLGLVYAHYTVYYVAGALGRPFGYGVTLLSLVELPWVVAIVATMAAMALADQREWAGRALRDQEAQYQRIIERLLAGVYILKEGRLEYVNEAFASIFGYERAELVGADPLQVVHPDHRHLVAEHTRKGLAGLEPRRQYEFLGLRKDGTTVRVLVLGSALELGDGERVVVGNLLDVSDRVWAQQHDRLMSTMLDAAPAGILVTDGTGHVLFANRSAALMHGMEQDALLRLDVGDLLAPVDRGLLRSWFARCKARGEATFEAHHIRADGSLVPVHVSAKSVDWHGTPAVLCVVTDLTSHRRAEAERERLATAIEQAGEAVVITDARGVIQYVNPAFVEVTGYTRAEALGSNPRVLKSGKHDAAFYRSMWATLTSGATWHGQLVNRRKDGSEFIEDATISPVRDAGGAINAYVAVKRDITQEMSTRAELTQAQRLESVGRLAGGVAHDFNNLLSVIRGYTDFALEALREGDPLRGDLEEVRAAAERASALTQQLLAFSRRQVLAPEVFDLNTVLVDLERMLRRLVGEHIELAVQPGEDLGRILGDPRQIEQVVMNLVVNARDAMPRGGRLAIETRNVELDRAFALRHPEVEPGPYVELSVADNGEGMDAGTRERVFEPFFTTKANGKGTGLGLATVYGIVRQTGGSILVESEPARGSTFRVYLPRVSGLQPAHRERPEARRPGGTETVLVVEDEDEVRRLAERILRSAGYAVLSAASGGDALVLKEKHPGRVHLLLTDVVMRHMGGPELVARMVESDPDLKVLYMSGYTDDALFSYGSPDLGPGLVAKPFSAEDLTRRVREALDQPRPATP